MIGLVLARDRYRLTKLEEDLRMYGYYFERDDETSISDRIRSAIITWEDLRRGKGVDLKSVRSCYVYIKQVKALQKNIKVCVMLIQIRCIRLICYKKIMD